MATLFVSGALANKPFNGGNAWTRLSWVLGFKQLGYPVYFVEEIDRNRCVDRSGAFTSFETSVNAAYFSEVMERFGLAQSSALILEGGERVLGLSLPELQAAAQRDGVLFNISGHLTYSPLLESMACRIYFDDDPGYTQFWHAAGQLGEKMERHDLFYSIGQNIGLRDCCIPTGNIRWWRTWPPVVLDEWPVCPIQPFDRFTTVASWRGAFGPVHCQGVTYGVKAHQFRKHLELPGRSGQSFELALQIEAHDGKDLDALLKHGWRIVDPKQVASSPHAFRQYVQSSSAEFSVAQGIYVETKSGWFSDRSVRYLASGRPVLVQDTGFTAHLPANAGLIAFRSLEEALEGVQRIIHDYENHCRAARRLAEEYFDSDRVIGQLATEVGLPRYGSSLGAASKISRKRTQGTQR